MPGKMIWIALGSLLLSLSAFAQELKPHTEFRIKLLGPLSTQANVKGDKLAAQVIAPKAFAGVALEGEITDCASKGLLHRKSVLRFTFRTLHLKKGPMPIASDVKQVSSSKGNKDADESGADIEHTSELLSEADPSLTGKADQALKRITGHPAAGAASVILVEMTSKEKNISFAPGSIFVLDVSPISEDVQPGKKPK